MTKSKEFPRSANPRESSGFPLLVLRASHSDSFPRLPVFRLMHWHEDLQFTLVKSGMLSLVQPDGITALSEGSAVFINRSALHRIETQDGCHYVSIRFPDTFLKFYPGSPAERHVDSISGNDTVKVIPLTCSEDWQKEIIRILWKIEGLERMPGPYYEYEALTFLSLVWMLFLPHFPVLAKTGQSETERRLRFFLIFIENHYQEDISLTDIAASAHVSKSECLRCFQTHLHTTPYRYLVDVRLKHAVNHLCSSHGTISEIALRSGFNHFSHFSRSFRAKTGMSPKEFRKRKFLDEKTGITSDTTLDD